MRQQRRATSYYADQSTRLKVQMVAADTSRSVSSVIDVAVKRYLRFRDKRASTGRETAPRRPHGR